MNDPRTPEDDDLDRWTVSLDEPESPPPVPPTPAETDAIPPDLLRFTDEIEPFPTEGYHPHLGRFGDAA